MQTIKHGHIIGTGSALNVQLGWIPDKVTIVNELAGTPVINIGFPRQKHIIFTSGGPNEIKAGHELVGATAGAKAKILEVITDTGSWSGEDAAGWFIIDAETETGTFETENAYFTGSSGTNDAGIVASLVTGVDVDTAVAADLGITRYLGTAAGNSMGFTIATAISVDGELLAYEAVRNG